MRLSSDAFSRLGLSVGFRRSELGLPPSAFAFDGSFGIPRQGSRIFIDRAPHGLALLWSDDAMVLVVDERQPESVLVRTQQALLDLHHVRACGELFFNVRAACGTSTNRYIEALHRALGLQADLQQRDASLDNVWVVFSDDSHSNSHIVLGRFRVREYTSSTTIRLEVQPIIPQQSKLRRAASQYRTPEAVMRLLPIYKDLHNVALQLQPTGRKRALESDDSARKRRSTRA